MENENIRKSDRFIPLYFVAFFCVLFIADGIMVYLALSTHTGVVDKKSYETGLAYNKVLNEAEAQKKSGWHSKIAFREDHLIGFVLYDADHNKVPKANVTGRVKRPTQDGYDFDITFKAVDKLPGHYLAYADFPLKGYWDIYIQATKENMLYKKRKKIMVKEVDHDHTGPSG